MAGVRKARVLPVPVWASPAMSLPSRAKGIAFSWIVVSSINPAFF